MAPSDRGPGVLLVEDQWLLREELASSLEEAGFNVVTADSGTAALAKFRDEVDIAVVVTDIGLGEGPSGWDVASGCLEQRPGLPVIYMSGEARDMARRVPDSLFFEKPYDPRVIVEACRSLAGRGAVTAVAEPVKVPEHPSLSLDSEGAARRRLTAIVESAEDAIVSKDLNGIIRTWNAGAERLFGYTASEAIGKHVTLLIPRDRHNEEPGILSRIRRGERIAHYETVRQHKDGSLIDISLTVSPIKDEEGRVIGASKIARDITEQKRTEEKYRLLIREMNHRIKNVFALTSGLVALSARSARTPSELGETVRDRLAALSRAHQLTLGDIESDGTAGGQQTNLNALVRTIMFPYAEADHGARSRFEITGPAIELKGHAVSSLALLLHELATNAAKYGALSSARGRIDIAWELADGTLNLTWQERGGPPLTGKPGSEGFGTLISRTTITGQLGGAISRAWDPEGLTVRLTIPASRLAQ